MSLSDGTDWAQRAIATAKVIDRRLFIPHRGLYGVRQLLFGYRFEYLWPFACAWSAACSLGSFNSTSFDTVHLESYLHGLTSYHRYNGAITDGTGPIGFSSDVVHVGSAGGDTYYDDNAWVALALLHQYAITKDRDCLNLAERVVEYVLQGWSTNDAWSHPGGIRWKEPISNTTRNTCSNGPIIEASVGLYEKTGDRFWLEWAMRIYAWTKSALRATGNLYADHIEANGSVEQTIWTYNQGTMIGAGVLLGQATGEQGYIDDAVATAGAAIARFNVDGLLQQPVAFNAIFLRNLLLMDQYCPDTGMRTLITQYGETMWQRRGANEQTLLPAGGSGSVLNGSMPLVQVYALLAGAAPGP